VSLPPLANLFAIYDPDPGALAALERALRASGEFRRVSRPAPAWVVATSPLPGGNGADPKVADGAVEFVEGQDLVCERLEELCQVTDRAPERLARLPGDFGFVRFRPDGSATAVRSCGGLVPFYLTRSRERIALATRLGDFARYLEDEPRIDPLPNAVWAMGWPLFPDDRSFLTNVSVLPRGSFALLGSSGRTTTHRYWDPRPTRLELPTPARAAEHAQRLRSLLVTKLERDLDPTGGNLLTLSGGVDSSSLAALAGGAVGRRFSTWSLLPEPDEMFRREFFYIDLLARRFNIERTWIARLGRETAIERSAPPVVFHVPHPALCALPRVLAEADVRVLFGGEFADEVCGSVFTIPDWAQATTLPDLVRGLRRLPFGRRAPLRWAKHRLLALARRPVLPFPRDLPQFVRPDVRQEYRAWAVGRRRAAASQPPAHRHLALRAEMDGFVAMNWEVASALGVRRSFPFFNREVLELAFECHPSELVGPGTKKLLRAALVDDVPHENLFRPDKGHWGNYLRGVQFESPARLPDALGSVVRPEWFPQPPHLLDLLNARALGVLTGFATALVARRRLH
jgi:asparagine synthetase B (glutamine-hydrolysing)